MTEEEEIAFIAEGFAINNRRQHAEIIAALRKKEESPLVKQYKILALNGQSLVVPCDFCRKKMSFPPEYAGQIGDCIHCKKYIQFYHISDLVATECPTCKKTSTYYKNYSYVCKHCGYSPARIEAENYAALKKLKLDKLTAIIVKIVLILCILIPLIFLMFYNCQSDLAIAVTIAFGIILLFVVPLIVFWNDL
jgi:hypothetical protein